MKNFRSSVLALCTLAVLSSSCIRVEGNIPFLNKKKSGRITNDSRNVNEQIGDEKITLQVLSESQLSTVLPITSPIVKNILAALPQGDGDGEELPDITPEVSEEKNDTVFFKKTENSLLLGFPIGLVGEQSIFGGVITKVSDKDNAELGSLKLTELSPIHVNTLITGLSVNKPALTLVGCVANCTESSPSQGLINFDIVGFNKETQMIILDLSSLGNELDLVSMLDPKGEYTKLKAISSATTSFEYSVSTLVFDINTKMIPVATPEAERETAPVTEFSVRWYLKLASAFNQAFEPRPATPGVGYFMTERSANAKVTRFSTTNNGKSVHYYIKNVPERFQKIFAGAFDNWNIEFKKIIGRNLLTYEFINADDPRIESIVAGDIRYNVMEWDLVNQAPYGGLGPSTANQFTGETLSANVLIQGPRIIDLYTEWFALSSIVRELKAEGKFFAANKMMKKFNEAALKETSDLRKTKFSLTLGKSLEMTVHSQRPELQDPIVKNHFELVPEGISFDEYMTGYFTEMLEHELGHNLGLRHNFKGNLGAYESGEKGSVSRSIMEYLGRPYRHLNAIGLYDKMAISYGYKGVAPKHLNWFCTDEDQGSSPATFATKSAECTKSDATSDPYSFWEGRLARAIDLVLETKSTSAPVWKVSEIQGELTDAINGLSAYALSAEKTSQTWMNFFGKGDRPENKEDVKAYVLNSFKKKICDPKLAAVIDSKETDEAKALAATNFLQLKGTIFVETLMLKLFTTSDWDCK